MIHQGKRWIKESKCSKVFLLEASKTYFFFLYILICIIGVTLVNKIIYVSGVQFCHTSSVDWYCAFTAPGQVSFHHRLSPHTLFYLPHPLCSGNHRTVICVYEGFFVNPFTFSPSPTAPSPPTAVSLFSINQDI